MCELDCANVKNKLLNTMEEALMNRITTSTPLISELRDQNKRVR